MTDNPKKRAALAALDFVKDGMTVALGTGSTAAFFIEALGEKVRQGLEISAIPTSQNSAEKALAVGITLIDADETTIIDLDVDGADEADPQGNLIKGGGAALLREKILAAEAKQFVVIADGSKDVAQLGAFPLPIEVEKFSWGLTVSSIRRAIAALGYDGVDIHLRAKDGEFVLTDGGNYVLDAHFGTIKDAKALDTALTMIPGVVTTGLFVDLADVLIFGTSSGVETRNV